MIKDKVSKYATLDNLIKVAKYFKPEFYNKLTWTTVVAGISIASTNLIDRLIGYFFDLSFDVAFTDGDDGLVGVAFVSIGLIYNFGVRLLDFNIIDKSSGEKQAKIEEHDLNVYKYLSKVLSENDVNEFIVRLESDGSYSLERKRPLDSFMRLSVENENMFIDKNLESAKTIFNQSLVDLDSFLAAHCFNYPRDQVDVLCLYPDLNIDRALEIPNDRKEQIFRKREEEMYELIDIIKNNYKHYRILIKKPLFV